MLKKKLLSGVTAVAVGLSMVASFATPASAALTQSQVDSIISLLNSFGADAATITNVRASLTGGTPTTGGGTTVVGSYNFTRDLTVGSTGDDVKMLQQALNNMGYTVAVSGAGSPGNETSYFGPATQSAVAKYQVAKGINPPAGYFGPLTRSSFNSTVSTGGTGNGTGNGTVVSGSGLSVFSASQPSANLAPQSASRVPFTKVTLSASSDGPVTVNGVTVERTGLAQDAVFAGLVLLDENGQQIGIAKTLNSNHQTTVGEPFTIPAGTSKTVTIAGNMASDLSSYAGQVAALSVVGVNTSATVNGSFPITGAGHTVNATLSIGSATMNTSSFDPNTSSTKEIGTTAYKFAGVRVTSGSAEKVRLWSIRWNQTGSASSNDLANVQVYVDGTAYPTTVSADGKYYTAMFGSGIVIDKGFSKDVYIQADIVGSSAAGRTVIFDIYKTTDVYITGETYSYGITPTAGSTSSASDDSSQFTTGTPFFDGSKVTVSAGSATTIAKANSVAAQNVAVNVPNQVLGGFETDIKGEALSVQSSVFHFTYSTTPAAADLLTNVSLYDENGSVVAGPVDAVKEGGGQKVTFTDTITYNVGKHTYTLKGTVDPDITNGVTIQASTTPSSDWSNITGQTTGNTISLSANGLFTMNTVTVKTAALAITVGSTPAAATIVPGGTSRTFATYQFDASQSGEDVRFSSIALSKDGDNNAKEGAATKLSNCQLFDGSTALNTGSNVVSPTNTATTTSPTSHTFTFDQSLTVPKGTIKTLTLKCSVSSTADDASTFQWGIAADPSITATGVTSSNDITESVTAAAGPVMTIGAGTLTITTDASSPSYAHVAAGTTGNVVGVYKFRATNEAINLNRIGLKLTNTASSSAADLVSVTLWDGATQVGSAVFTGSNTVATSTLSSSILLPKDQDKTITVKADFGTIGGTGAGSPATPGHLIAIDVNANDTTGTEGTGADSGSTINLATSGSSASTAVAGVRINKSYPTVAEETGTNALPTSGIADGKLMRFKVTANSNGDVGVSKFSLTIATTTLTVTGINIFAFTDSAYSTPVTGLSSDGRMLATNNTSWASSATELEFTAQTAAGASTTIQIPAGQTRYFEVRGSVAGATSGATAVTTLLGDAAYPQLSGFMAAFTGINNEAGSNNDFIWSPNSTTTVTTDGFDWTNGYGVVGLPSGGVTKTRSSN